ncbi:MAG: ATP-dependent chaperone ClpB [Prochlorococcus sp. SP3034]|nr:ATP-dependent chaperone ClpB [Prochlorococcus sp. SP3034]
MRKTLTSNPELFSDLSWDLLLLGEETAKKWGHNELNIEHIIQTLFTAGEFANFVQNLSIDSDVVLDITEDFLEENPINETGLLTIGEDLEILLDNAYHIKNQWGTNLIEIPHLLIAIANDERIGCFVFEEGNLSIEKLEAELKIRPNLDQAVNNKFNIQRDLLPNNVIDSSVSLDEKKGSNIVLNTNKAIKRQDFPKENEESALAMYGKDITDSARKGLLDPVIGREVEINNLMRVLSRRNKNNPILIGDSGVGKTAITQLLAQLISQQKVPDSLKGLKIISLDLGALVSGTKFRGQLEERLRSILEELKNPKEGVILLIDDIHTILNSDRSTTDISSILKPLLSEGDLRCIGATTPEKFREIIEKDQALNSCFQKIYVNEPSLELSSIILNSIKRKYELHHGIIISKEAVDYAAKLSGRYINDKCLPDKAIDLIDEAAAQLKIQSSTTPKILLQEQKKIEELNNKINNLPPEDFLIKEKYLEQKDKKIDNLNNLNERWIRDREKLERLLILMEEEDNLNKKFTYFSQDDYKEDLINQIDSDINYIKKDIKSIEDDLNKSRIKNQLFINYEVKPEDIADVVSKMTGIPITKVVANERRKLINLEKEISQKVIGQDPAISIIASAIRRARAGMKNPKKPIGSFLFMGPTGVGKTELAKSLASSLFDEEEALLRLDMSEYMERNAVARLLGAPPGYVGYEEGGQLTEAVKRKPYSVILLDEIEKAHNEVFNILLQVLDEGRLTDSRGNVIDFKNTVIIMTSNLAGKAILDNVGELKSSVIKNDSLEKTLDEEIDKSLNSIFRPEFLNRIDEVIKFAPLSIEKLEKISLLQIEDLKKLLLEQDIEIKIDKKVIKKIAMDSFVPQYGARAIGRELRRQIENPLATKLLENNFKNKRLINIKVDPKDNDMILFVPGR